MKRLALVGACGLAVVAVLLLARSGDPGAAAPVRPLAVRLSFDPPTVQFGDPVTARISVLVDRHTSIRVDPDLAPLTRLGSSRTTVERGPAEVVAVSVRAVCIAEACTAKANDTPLRLAPVRVSAGALHAVVQWPALHIHSRVSTADLAASPPPFRGSTQPPPPTYRLAPGTLAVLLDVLASLLAVGAVVLAGTALVRLRERRSTPVRGELELALLRAREAESRPGPDRRRALALLARTLDRRDASLAGAARDLAWSQPAPDRDELAGLTDDVERTVAD